MEIKEYLDQAIRSFASDPADSPYQHGYLAAMIELAAVFCPELEIPPEILKQTVSPVN